MDITIKEKRDVICSKLDYAEGGSLNIDIKTVYKFQEILGGGQYGTVRVAHKIDNPNKKYAVKSISKAKLDKRQLSSLLTEVQILSNLDHPNIIKLIETYQDSNYLHIVTDLCTGKDVYTHCAQINHYSEKKISDIIFKILTAIAYLNDNAIVHRDIKPANILFDSNDPDAEVKLLDFGLSFKYNTNQKLHSKTGTPYYVSPEVIKGEYDAKCDIWSVGVLAYLLLSGDLPFTVPNSENFDELYDKILNNSITFISTKWRGYSRKAIDFVSRCLNKDPFDRIDVHDALIHKWFDSIKKARTSNFILTRDILQNIQQFSHTVCFKRMVMKFLINSINKDELKMLQNQFNLIDFNYKGIISKKEFESACKVTNLKISNEELNKIISEYEGDIRYSDFIAACFDKKKLITKQKLIEAFKYFDIDNNGYIDSKDVNNAFLRIGKKLNEDVAVKYIIEQVSSKPGKNYQRISLDEFFALFDY